MRIAGRRHPFTGAWLIVMCLLIPGARAVGTQREEASNATRCNAVLEDPKLRAVLARMNGLSKTPVSVWNGYRPDHQTYVFVVNDAAGASCGVVWRDGAVRTTLAFEGVPRLSTPMFGYHFQPPEERSAVQVPVQAWESWSQPPAIAKQLSAAGVARATLIPIVPAIRLPFELTDLHVFDMAVHEGFHVNVQAPAWLGVSSQWRWPEWDRRSPNRRQLVAQCYASAEAPVAAERQMLVDAAVNALDNGPESAICPAAQRFIAARRARWSAVASAVVPDQAGESATAASMSCEQAEAVMELREGVADFVFWLTALDSGSVTRERVAQRFGASQPELFYLTGSMQLAILRRLSMATFSDVTGSIVASESWRSGSIFNNFETEIARRCR